MAKAPKKPQRITRQRKEAVVMISDEQCDQPMVKSRKAESIVQFFRESPLAGIYLDWARDKDTRRDVRL